MLRDAPCSKPKIIRFSNEHMETKLVIDAFLSLAVPSVWAERNRIDRRRTMIPRGMLSTFVNLIAFLVKYDCDGALELLSSEFRRYVRDGSITPCEAYCLGAIGDDPELCALSAAIAARTPRTLDVNYVPAFVRRLAPPEYLYALSQVSPMLCRDPPPKRMRSKFRRYLTEGARGS